MTSVLTLTYPGVLQLTKARCHIAFLGLVVIFCTS